MSRLTRGLQRLYLAVALALFIAVSLAVLAGCVGPATTPNIATPAQSTQIADISPVLTAAPSIGVEATISLPDALATHDAALIIPERTYSPTPTIDPSLPTATLTVTPVPTPTTQPILLTDPVPDPHQTEVQWFAATGHTLRGTFLDYWEKHSGLPQLGYPITEEFFEPVGSDDKLFQVQYFERARMELHPEKAGIPDEVQLELGGTELAQQKGYLSGRYPAYGHAVDFSWVSGKIHIHVLPIFQNQWGGCSIMGYHENGDDVRLEGPVWRTFEYHNPVLEGKGLIVFGHWAGPGEQDSPCPQRSIAAAYIVEQPQLRP